MPTKRDFKIKTGYTLIELLTIISVIGLLTTIGLVAFTNAREKAQTSRGLKFSSEVYQALGAEVAVVWTFDEGSGSTIKDGAGYGINGTLNGPTWSTDTPSGKGSSLSFDGNDYIQSSYVRGVNANQITVSAWIKPNTVSGDYEISNQDQWDGGPWTGWRFRQTSRAIYLKLGDGSSNYYEYSAGAISSNVWQHVVGVWDGSYIRIYVNGKEAGKSAKSFTYLGNTGSHYIGKYAGAAYYFNGLIDDIRVYSVALSSAQIEKHYAEGLEKHKNLAAVE